MNFVIVRRDTITPEMRKKILERDKFTCRYCGSKQEPFHLDHVYPVAKGGETSEGNLVTSCSFCNSHKHKLVGIWPKPIGYFELQKQYNPPLLTGLILVLGVALLSFSLFNPNSYFIWSGFLLCSFGMGRVLTGR